MAEGRKYSRKQVNDYVIASDIATGRIVGRVVNMSAGGVRIMSADALECGKQYRLGISLPGGSFDHENLELTAECRWNSLEKRSDLWENGMEIREMGADDRRVLQQVVLGLMAHNGECRGAGSDKVVVEPEKVEYVRMKRYR